MDRAWHLLNRAPRTKPQPHFPEPRRNKTHWDHLLEEMRWLAGDFVRERKFRAKLARKAAHAVARSNLDLESRVVKRAQDELIAARKTARNVANQVMHFWIKVEKVVRFKAQSAIDAKRKTVMDKHLDFLLGQTERYSTMLAAKLTGERRLLKRRGRRHPRGTAAVRRSRVRRKKRKPGFRRERPTADERAAQEEETTRTRRYAAPKRRTRGDARGERCAAEAEAEGGRRPEKEAADLARTPSQAEDSCKVRWRTKPNAPEGDEPVVREDTRGHVADPGRAGGNPAPGEYVAVRDDEDDEATLEEEMRRAEAEDEDAERSRRPRGGRGDPHRGAHAKVQGDGGGARRRTRSKRRRRRKRDDAGKGGRGGRRSDARTRLGSGRC